MFKCSKCGKEKVAADFYRDNSKKRKLRSTCIECDYKRRPKPRQKLKQNAKSGSAVKNLGCSIAELKHWLEQQFYCHPETINNNLEGSHV